MDWQLSPEVEARYNKRAQEIWGTAVRAASVMAHIQQVRYAALKEGMQPTPPSYDLIAAKLRPCIKNERWVRRLLMNDIDSLMIELRSLRQYISHPIYRAYVDVLVPLLERYVQMEPIRQKRIIAESLFVDSPSSLTMDIYLVHLQEEIGVLNELYGRLERTLPRKAIDPLASLTVGGIVGSTWVMGLQKSLLPYASNDTETVLTLALSYLIGTAVALLTYHFLTKPNEKPMDIIGRAAVQVRAQRALEAQDAKSRS